MNRPSCLKCRNYHVVVAGEPDAELVEGDAPGVLEPLPRIGECRARPPVPFMLAVPEARLDGKQGVQVNFPAAWPQLQPLAWCGEFVPKVPNG